MDTKRYTKDAGVVEAYLDRLILHPATPAEVPQGESYFYDWDESLPWSSQTYVTTLPKDPGRDFVILNLADIQCHDGEAYSIVGEFAEETIDKLIEMVHPALITLTGDNAFDAFAWLRLIDFLERYAIPWAPVMGNADHTGLVSEFWAAYRMTEAKHCLFRCGPQNMGYGNYIINITENGRPVHTLFFMDTHHEEEMQAGSYDHLYDSQIRWYRWAVEGIAKENGGVVPSSVFFHIPVPEYQDAWQSILNPATGEPYAQYRKDTFCQVKESYGNPLFNNGFFDLCRALGSTKNILCGHDHVNCFSIPYKGIRLTYTMKTGYGCYWEKNTTGGTTLTVRSDGSTETAFHYIDPAESKIPGFLRWYYEVYLPSLEGK